MAAAERVDRRAFVKAVAAGAFAAPTVVAAEAFGANERITLGAIGFGGRGSGVFRSLTALPDVQGLAASDVMQDRLRRARGLGLAVYRDFREMLARDDLDAVVIASPSHWKPLHTIAAAKAGKDVYCEKPMSLTVRDGRAMVDAVRRYGRVFQHGTQQRSSREFRFACEMVRSGRIGELKEIYVYVGGDARDCYLPAEPVPEGVDWEGWLGPAPWRPFNRQICMVGCGGWEGYRDYSGGGMTGWGSHHFDIAQWGLDTDTTGPVEIIPPGAAGASLLTFIYGGGVKVYQDGRDRTWAVAFHGSEGKVTVNRGKLQTTPASLMQTPTRPGEVQLYHSNNHAGNFVQSIRTRQPAICDVETGHRTMTVAHLGNIAYRLGRPLRWDPAQERFLGDPEADRHLDRPRREPWTL